MRLRATAAPPADVLLPRPLPRPATPRLRADIAPPKGAPVRPFRVDPAALSPCAVADALWDAVGAAHGLPPA